MLQGIVRRSPRTQAVNAEVKAGQRAGAKPGQFAARRRVRSAASAPAEMAGISQPGRTRLSGSYGDFAGFWIGSCNGLGGGPRVTPPPCLRLLEPVALAVQLQNMDMMREAIEKRAGQTLIAEDARPFLEWKIRRDDGRATFVTLAEYFKQKLRAGLRERHIAEFVDDEPVRGRVMRAIWPA